MIDPSRETPEQIRREAEKSIAAAIRQATP